MLLRKYNCKLHKSSDLEHIFGTVFRQEFNTILIGGAEEPLYKPATKAGDVHRIFYTQDYFASALHEVAHWCVAGQHRRLQEDYGYWYAPDGRNEEQQNEFEKVEVKPQAIEWHFSISCGATFRVSADNLDKALGPSVHFIDNICKQARDYANTKLPARAALFCRSLSDFYGVKYPVLPSCFHKDYFTNSSAVVPGINPRGFLGDASALI